MWFSKPKSDWRGAYEVAETRAEWNAEWARDEAHKRKLLQTLVATAGSVVRDSAAPNLPRDAVQEVTDLLMKARLVLDRHVRTPHTDP